jgi:hypothetical protein
MFSITALCDKRKYNNTASGISTRTLSLSPNCFRFLSYTSHPNDMSESNNSALKPEQVLRPGMIDRTVLQSVEVFWCDRQKWFEDCGYMLRPRYIPGWKPSWLGKSGKLVIEYEDAQMVVVRTQPLRFI